MAPKLSAKTEQALEEAERAWALVRNGIGFHRYARLKHRLLQLQGPDDAALNRIANEESVTLEQLREVAGIARRPMTAFGDGPG